LFGRHVARCAHDRPGLRDGDRRAVARSSRLGFAKEPGEAEVEDLELAVAGQEEVPGLEVAVHHAGRVGRGQPLAELHRVLHRPPRGQGLALESLAQRLPLEQLERQEGHAMVGADVVDAEDVGVIERRDRQGLLLEPVDPVGIG
jgi:hypothetical protein